MKKQTERLVETTLLISLPIALLIGCVGSGDKKEELKPNNTTITENYFETVTPKQLEKKDQFDDSELPTVMTYTETEQQIAPSQHIFYFATNKSDVTPNDYVQLKKHADFLDQHPNLMITIGGHTDQSGQSKYNLKLSQQRADAVANLLLQFGVAESQILVVGHGESTGFAGDIELARRVELEYTSAVTISAR